MPTEKLSYARLTKALPKIARSSVLVVGDVALDTLVWGTPLEAVSAVAPSHIGVDTEQTVLGSAGALVSALAALGAEAHLVTTAGADDAAEGIRSILAANDQTTEGVFSAKDRATAVHTIVYSNRTPMLQMVRRDFAPANEELLRLVSNHVRSTMVDVDYAFLVDYGGGMITQELAQLTVDSCAEHGVPLTEVTATDLVADRPHAKTVFMDAGTSHLPPGESPAAAGSVIRAARSGATDLAQTTLGVWLPQGSITAAGPNSDILHQSAVDSDRVVERTGLFEAAAAVFGAAVASGNTIEEATELSIITAGLVAEHPGPLWPGLDALRQRCRHNSPH